MFSGSGDGAFNCLIVALKQSSGSGEGAFNCLIVALKQSWIPAFAGMTDLGECGVRAWGGRDGSLAWPEFLWIAGHPNTRVKIVSTCLVW